MKTRTRWLSRGNRPSFDFLVNDAGLGINVRSVRRTEEDFDRLRNIHPRACFPDDIGPTVASLPNDDNRWINAQRIEASGGMFVRGGPRRPAGIPYLFAKAEPILQQIAAQVPARWHAGPGHEQVSTCQIGNTPHGIHASAGGAVIHWYRSTPWCNRSGEVPLIP